MAANVARGLFRLWLVLCVLWVAGAGVVTWWSLPEPISSPQLGVVEYGRPWEKYQQQEQQSARDRQIVIQTGVLLAFVPPALLLTLGSALFWVFRGFRPRDGSHAGK